MTDLGELVSCHAPKPPVGLVLARVAAADAPLEVASAGPVDAATVFELGSVTKALTGLLLADAVVRGEVELATPLQDVLPGARSARPIPLGALAAHTSGLPRLPLAFLRRRGLFDLTDPYAGTTVAELVGDLGGVRRRSARPRYSNFGAALLGQALAARAAAPYEQLVHERLLAPLGVDGLWLRDAPPVATPHDRKGRPVPAWTLDAFAPAGALRGTVPGLVALTAACAWPPEALAAAVDLALTVHARRGRLEHGLGWLRMPTPGGGHMWWHNGATHGSRAVCGFVRETGAAAAAALNGTRSLDGLAALALSPPPRRRWSAARAAR